MLVCYPITSHVNTDNISTSPRNRVRRYLQLPVGGSNAAIVQLASRRRVAGTTIMRIASVSVIIPRRCRCTHHQYRLQRRDRSRYHFTKRLSTSPSHRRPVTILLSYLPVPRSNLVLYRCSLRSSILPPIGNLGILNHIRYRSHKQSLYRVLQSQSPDHLSTTRRFPRRHHIGKLLLRMCDNLPQSCHPESLLQ